MTDALRYIQAELRRGHTRFLVPARMLHMEDRPLWQRGALAFRGAYLSKVRCPECGKLVEVDRTVDETGDPRYSVLCLDCETLEERSVPPESVELLEFHIRAFKLYVDDPSVSGEYVEDAASCLPVGATVESPVAEIDQPDHEEQANEIQALAKQVVASRFTGRSWCNIRISKDGRAIELTQNKFRPNKIMLRFKGLRQWEIIDALFAAWENSFGKAEVGNKTQVEKVFSTKCGKYLLKFIHFETRTEAKVSSKKGNHKYTGYAWFERSMIYPGKFALKKE